MTGVVSGFNMFSSISRPRNVSSVSTLSLQSKVNEVYHAAKILGQKGPSRRFAEKRTEKKLRRKELSNQRLTKMVKSFAASCSDLGRDEVIQATKVLPHYGIHVEQIHSRVCCRKPGQASPCGY